MTRANSAAVGGAALVALVAVLDGGALADQPELALAIEAGTEYDSNPLRLELVGDGDAGVDGSPLFRLGARGRLSWRPSSSSRLALQTFAGAKWFTEDPARDENVVIAQVNARYDLALPSRRALVGVRFDNYQADGFDLGGGGIDTRTFSSRDPALSVTLIGPGAHRFTGHAGVRWFRYNPDADFDWFGDHYGVDYSTNLWSDDDAVEPTSLGVRAGYRLERRDYRGRAFANGCGPDPEPEPGCFVPTARGRDDLYHAAYAEVSFAGERIYAARYELQVADSNSFGQSLVRHKWELSVTSELPWGLFATARGFIRYNVFLDPLLLARDVQNQTFISIEDENRNGLVVHVARDFADSWTAEVRYSLYSNEFASRDVSFRRQTAYGGLVYRFEPL